MMAMCLLLPLPTLYEAIKFFTGACMEWTLFAVDDEPYCLWEHDLAERTRDFLNGLDPEFFKHSLEAQCQTEDGSGNKVSAQSGHRKGAALFEAADRCRFCHCRHNPLQGADLFEEVRGRC